MKTTQKTLERVVDVTRQELESFAKKVTIPGANRANLEGYCLIGTYLLYKAAKLKGIELTPIYGKYCHLGEFSMNPDNRCHHWWAAYENRIVVDVTASQFISDKVYIGESMDKYWDLKEGFDYEYWYFNQTPEAHERQIKNSLWNIEKALEK